MVNPRIDRPGSATIEREQRNTNHEQPRGTNSHTGVAIAIVDRSVPGWTVRHCCKLPLSPSRSCKEEVPMQIHNHSFAWLVLLLSPYALGAETFAPEPASGPPTL